MNAPMNRLLTQWQRLYWPPGTAAESPETLPPVSADGRVRALVLTLCRPADWSVLSAVWRGVQRDLELPAPGIAVDGVDGLALWFSLAASVTLGEAAVFLSGLQMRYMPEVPVGRVHVWPSSVEAERIGSAPPRRVPPHQTAEDRWAAFVAPDLAAVFADDPALDMPPGEDAQAEQLSRLTCITPAAFGEALARLGPQPLAEAVPSLARPSTVPPLVAPPEYLAGPYQDPRQFLLDVMNSPQAPLGERIEAATALLQASRAS